MAFMRAAVSDTKDYFLISEDLEESVFCKWNGIDLPVGEYREDDDPLEDEEMQEQVDGVFKEYSIKQFEIIYAFHGLLEASAWFETRLPETSTSAVPPGPERRQVVGAEW